MKMSKYLIVPALLVVAACQNTGANYQPVIDGPVSANYGYDLQQCQQLAANQGLVNGNTATTAAAGGGAAAIGAAALSNKGHNVRDAAALGVLAGVAGSALQNNQNRQGIIANCMRGRGYRVVG